MNDDSSLPHALPPAGAPPDRLATLARFILSCRFRDEGAKMVAVMQAFPAASYSEVMQAEAIALQIVKERIAGDRPTEGGEL